MLNKDRVMELVVQSGLQEYAYGHDQERFATALSYFATALQHEALKAAKRGDAEPVACIATNGALMWLKKPEVLYSKPVPLFKHPAPAVVRQLVEALEHHQEQTRPIQQTIDALAAAKESGL